jgi:hypothetical protein
MKYAVSDKTSLMVQYSKVEVPEMVQISGSAASIL